MIKKIAHMFDVLAAAPQVRVNIANGDMVGHTGNLEATIVGCSATDKAIKVTLFYLHLSSGEVV